MTEICDYDVVMWSPVTSEHEMNYMIIRKDEHDMTCFAWLKKGKHYVITWLIKWMWYDMIWFTWMKRKTDVFCYTWMTRMNEYNMIYTNERDKWSWHMVHDWNDDMINKMNIRWYDLIWYDMSYMKDRDERYIYIYMTWYIYDW